MASLLKRAYNDIIAAKTQEEITGVWGNLLTSIVSQFEKRAKKSVDIEAMQNIKVLMNLPYIRTGKSISSSVIDVEKYPILLTIKLATGLNEDYLAMILSALKSAGKIISLSSEKDTIRVALSKNAAKAVQNSLKPNQHILTVTFGPRTELVEKGTKEDKKPEKGKK